MLNSKREGVYYKNGAFLPAREGPAAGLPAPEEAKKGTMAYAILSKHNTARGMEELAIRFDAMASHDITYVGIIQTARASGMTEFPVPYVLTNCHNSLCAVGGTINEDDHVFGLSAAKKYGGEFVPAHQSVIHSYMRERYAAPGKMILGSDSHTRYGAYGTMAIGEGGPELARQLLKKTYNIAYPKVIAIYLTGAPRPGVGPQDVALALVKATFQQGVVKNAVMEFFGPGVKSLSMDYRSGIDVMTTETTCLSSVWETDDTLRDHLTVLGRGDAYQRQAPAEGAYYDGVIEVALDRIEPMIALPFHPSNAYTIREFKANLDELLHQVDEDAVRQLGLKHRPASLREKIVEREPLSLDLIRTVHRVLTEGTYDERRYIVNGERPGEFKKHDYVTGRNEVGSPPDEVEADLTELIDEVNSIGQKAPLKAGAYFHARFENIHPFADGNGRVGRTLLNYWLMINDCPPMIIYEENRRTYYEALQAYDEQEELDLLNSFFEEQTVKTWARSMELNDSDAPQHKGLDLFMM